MSYKLKIRGSTYTVHTNQDGSVTYDPPLPQEIVDKGKANVQEMLESRQVPGTRSDTDFHRGRGSLLDQCDGDHNIAKYVVQEARKQGYNPGSNDVYIGQLASRPGDPKAFFKPGEGRSELKKRLQEKGMGCEAPGLSVKPREYVEAPSVKLSPKLTKEMSNFYRRTGEAEGMSDSALKEMVVKRHGWQG